MTPVEVSRRDLEALVVSVPDFARLERRICRYNAFKVLGISRAEIRHSNVLAWLLNPRESHGFGDDFFRRFFRIVVHESTDAFEGVPSALDVDAWDILAINVRREWLHIDLLLLVSLSSGEKWAVLIENKIESIQGAGQLSTYKTALASRPELHGHKPLLVYLSLHREPPQDSEYIQANYGQVYRALQECIEHHADAMGSGPRGLLADYGSLLEELSMEDNDLVRLAKSLYCNHREVLDFIFDHRPDPYDRISSRLQEFLRDSAAELQIVLKTSDRYSIRFIPTAWDVPANRAGSAWEVNGPVVTWEVSIWEKGASIKAVEGKAPDTWRQNLYALSAKPPFNYRRSTMPSSWMTVYTRKLEHLHGMPQEDDEVERVAESIVDKVGQFIKSSEYAAVTARIAELLAELS